MEGFELGVPWSDVALLQSGVLGRLDFREGIVGAGRPVTETVSLAQGNDGGISDQGGRRWGAVRCGHMVGVSEGRMD